MSLLLQLLSDFLRCIALLCKEDGLKAVVAQNLLLRQQLIVLNSERQPGPSVSPLHRNCLRPFRCFCPAQIQIPVFERKTVKAWLKRSKR